MISLSLSLTRTHSHTHSLTLKELLQIVRSTTSVGVENPGIRAPHVLSATQPPFIPGRPPPVFAQPPIHPAIHQQQLAQQQQQQQQLAQQQQQRQVYQGASGPGGQVRPGLVDPGRHTHFTSPAASASAFAYGSESIPLLTFCMMVP